MKRSENPLKLKEKCYEKLLCMIKYMIFVCRHHSFEIKKTSYLFFFQVDWMVDVISQLNVKSFTFSTFWNINLILDLKPSFIMKEANRSKFIMHYVLYQGRNSYFTRLISYKLLFLPRRGKSWSPIVLNCQTLMENWLYVSKKAISKCIWTCHKI